MSRLIFVPQYPASLRYQKFWFIEFPRQFRRRFDEVLVLGEGYLQTDFGQRNAGMFSPIELSIEFEIQQINEYMRVNIQPDDTLFLADISFPGFFTGALYHKPCPKMYAFCHASALNAYDYWAPVRNYKWKLECQHARMFDGIFVGTYYHARKLGWRNVSITGLPDPPFKGFSSKKCIDIISVARPSIQKVNRKLEKCIEKEFGKIIRTPDFNNRTWNEYYKLLSRAKVMITTSKEETFGYQIVDAIMNGVVPLAPNKYSYPELLPVEYLYNCKEELFGMIRKYLNKPVVPKLVCQDMVDKFYDEICGIMKGE